MDFGAQITTSPDDDVEITSGDSLGLGPSMLGYHIPSSRNGANKPFRFNHLES